MSILPSPSTLLHLSKAFTSQFIALMTTTAHAFLSSPQQLGHMQKPYSIQERSGHVKLQVYTY